MFTKNIKDTFTANLLSAVSGVLGEAKKKCPADCECDACTDDSEEDTNEGYMPTNDLPDAHSRKVAGKLGQMLKREREAKEKKETNGVKTEETVEEGKRGLWDNIHAKQERIKHGSGERMRKPGSKGAPTAQDFKDSQKESVELEEGTMRLSKVHIVHHHDHPAAKEFAKNYTAALKGNHRDGGPTAADDKAADAFHMRYTGVKTRDGFAGSGTHIYTDHKNGAKWKVDRHPNGKTFYGTDHIISHHSDSVHEEVELEENQQYVELTNAHTNSKSYIPVHKTQAFAALNHYRSFSHNKGVRIIDKKQHDAIQAAKTPWNPSGEGRSPFKEELEEAWVVKKGTEVVSSHKSKDEADVKAMKNPMYKVCAKEEAEIEEAVGDITVKKLSPDEAFKKHTGQMTKKTSVPVDPKTGKTLYQKVTSEEAEQIDELSKATMGRYINKAATKMGSQGVTAGLKIAADEKSSKNFKDMGKREKGIKLAVNKLTKEESEQIDEISKKTLGRYVNKATDDVEASSFIAGKDSDSGIVNKNNVNRWIKQDKRKAGIAKAVNRLTKEEQEFIDALNDADIEQIDEISKGAALKYLSANKKDDAKARETGDYDRMTKRMRGTDMAVRKYTAKPGSKSVRVPATEEVELDEARGRPKKAGAKDFTIHPRTKEKLMHDNPAHMKKIELLQKNGILQKPKTEAGQNIMTQLQKAKTSMQGGSTIHFTHGDSKEVSGTHAAKLLDKHAGMKPHEKEAFQKKIGHSHANLKSEL